MLDDERKLWSACRLTGMSQSKIDLSIDEQFKSLQMSEESYKHSMWLRFRSITAIQCKSSPLR